MPKLLNGSAGTGRVHLIRDCRSPQARYSNWTVMLTQTLQDCSNMKDEQDSVCVKSQSGCAITLGGCPLLWASKLQKEIALSTAEAEYIALLTSLYNLLPIRWQFKELVEGLRMVRLTQPQWSLWYSKTITLVWLWHLLQRCLLKQNILWSSAISLNITRTMNKRTLSLKRLIQQHSRPIYSPRACLLSPFANCANSWWVGSFIWEGVSQNTWPRKARTGLLRASDSSWFKMFSPKLSEGFSASLLSLFRIWFQI